MLCLERFRDPEYNRLFIRGVDDRSRALLKHCAGSRVVPSRDLKEVTEVALAHGWAVMTTDHESVKAKK